MKIQTLILISLSYYLFAQPSGNTTQIFEKLINEKLIEALSKEIKALKSNTIFIGKESNSQILTLLETHLLSLAKEDISQEDRLSELKTTITYLKALIIDNMDTDNNQYVNELLSLSKKLDNVLLLLDFSELPEGNNKTSTVKPIVCEDICIGGVCEDGKCIQKDEWSLDFVLYYVFVLTLVIVAVVAFFYWFCKWLVNYFESETALQHREKKEEQKDYAYEMKGLGQEDSSYQRVEVLK